NHDMFISSAALMVDGNFVAAGAEERFTRHKQTRDFPRQAIHFCLQQANCGMEDIDYVISSWNPGVYFQTFNPLLSARRRWKGEYLYSVPDHILSMHNTANREGQAVQQSITIEGHTCRIHYITHHRAHAGNAFFLSPFAEAAILTADSQGETEATTFAHGSGHAIQHLKSILYPQSVGGFYSTITEYLGFRPNSDEWKVMALASYADARNEYTSLFKNHLYTLLPEGEYEFDLTYLQGFLHDLPHLFSPKLEALLGPSRQKGDPLTERHYAIAAALQHCSEEIALHMLRWLHEKTQSKRLAVSGGFFMNSVLNGKIPQNSPFEEIYVSSCPDDSGAALGAVAYFYHHVLGHEQRQVMKHNFFGPQYSNAEIQETLSKYKLQAKTVEDIETHTAELISQGLLIGWFQGRMEFGQRALGNRSILADPRSSEMKDRVNQAVKYRETFRPFAPAVLKEKANHYFEMDKNIEVPFMEKVYPIRPQKRAEIPAVTHVDGSGRLQTVSADTNPRFYRLIQQFEAITGVPVLLNTSFNLNGEPIVCTPTDAIRTFFSCGLDVLVMGNHVLCKSSDNK
ncbi:carbamoyltransferase, partial [bacterium]|nr:carbamoyltransferase [bacterium]